MTIHSWEKVRARVGSCVERHLVSSSSFQEIASWFFFTVKIKIHCKFYLHFLSNIDICLIYLPLHTLKIMLMVWHKNYMCYARRVTLTR